MSISCISKNTFLLLTATETGQDYYPMFFSCDNAFKEFFCQCIRLFNKTWKEMRAELEDFPKVHMDEFITKFASPVAGEIVCGLDVKEWIVFLVTTTETVLAFHIWRYPHSSNVRTFYFSHFIFNLIWIIYLFICLFIYLFVCLFVCLSVCLFVCLSVCLFVCLFVWGVGVFVCLFVCWGVCLFVGVLGCLFVCCCCQ